jgi:glycosyltransferase involved in cell wall biosynthesis
MKGLVAPVMAGDLPLDSPLPRLNHHGRYTAARLLVRLHNRPMGEIVVPLAQRPVTPGQLAEHVWPQIGDRVAKHCAEDGIPPPARLTAAGLVRLAEPPCTAGRPAAGRPAITVIIATRDRTGSLLRCLTSLSRLDYPAFDVVVADSAPRTETTARALAGEQPWPYPLRYVRAARPGLAVAHNTALAQVTGEIVAITDDDVEVDPGWLAALADAFTESEATCVTGLILPAELETQAQLLVEQAGGYGRGFNRRTFRRDMDFPSPLFPFTAGRFGSGANMAFRAGWLAGSGGFDPATGAGTPARGGDDLAAFLRVITDGGTLVYEPAAVLRHWHRRGYEGMRRLAFGYGVGLGAYLSSSLCTRPGLLGPMLRRAVPAARHLLGAGSVRNENRDDRFPRELVWRERAGFVAGPFAYAASRRRYRDFRHTGSGAAPALAGTGTAPGTAPGTGEHSVAAGEAR